MTHTISRLVRLFIWLIPAIILAATIILFFVSDAQFAIGFGGICATLYGASYHLRKAREREAEARLFTEKAAAYEEIIGIISSVFKSVKGLAPPVDAIELGERLMDVRSKMIVWGGIKTIRAIDSFSPNPNSDQKTTINVLANLYSAIREDLGHSDPPNSGREIALGNIHANDRDELR